MSYLAWAGAAFVGVLVVMVIINLKAVDEISRRAANGGKRVVRVRLKALRSPFVSGLTPLALVYRVTTMTEAESSRANVRLYAYDPGRWFSRHVSSLRQFSGGVWRDA